MYEKWGKRLIDVLCSAAALTALSPLMALAALAIWLEDRRSPIYRQERLGRNLRPFKILKFRTMAVSTEHIPSANLQAPPITRTGAVLRRLNIDELPQLFNILRGEMSLVGPRPALAGQTNLIALREAAGACRALPGLTGLAQIRAYDNMPDDVKAGYDGEYARRVTFGRDLAIIARTVGYLLKPPPTY